MQAVIKVVNPNNRKTSHAKRQSERLAVNSLAKYEDGQTAKAAPTPYIMPTK